jgi:hypothetical protein
LRSHAVEDSAGFVAERVEAEFFIDDADFLKARAQLLDLLPIHQQRFDTGVGIEAGLLG